MSNKHVSKENLEEALGLVAQVVPFRKGTGNKSITGMTDKNGSVRPTASGNYAMSIGTSDISVLGDLESAVSSANIVASMPEASGNLSGSIGLSTKAISSGSIAVGIQNTAGIKGYYWHSISPQSDGTAKIILSKSQTNLLSFSPVAKDNSFDWAIGDYISIVNKQKYSYCAKITAISETIVKVVFTNYTTVEITVDKSPFGSDAYGTLESIVLAPDDKTIYAISRTQNSTTLAHTITPRSGTVELGWGAQAFGLNNTVAGTFGTAFGANNFQAGDFGLISGRDNVGAYGNFVIGGWNESTGLHSGLIGRYLTNKGNYNFLTGYENASISSYSTVGGIENTDNGDFGNIIFGRGNTVTRGNTNAVFGGRYSGGTDTEGYGNIVGGFGNLVSGCVNVVDGNFSLVQGAKNTSDTPYTYLLGRKLTSKREYQTIIGRNNVADSDAIFIIGNGLTSDDPSHASNALTVSSGGKLTTNSIKSKNEVEAASVKTSGDIYSSGRVTALKNFVSGGSSNVITESYYNIISGTSNTLTGPTNSTDKYDGNILIGNKNTVGSSSIRVKNTLVSGHNNKVNGSYTAIAGYHVTQLDGDVSAANFGGGNEISFSGKCNTFGGSHNNIIGECNVVGGIYSDVYGNNNIVAGLSSKVGTKKDDVITNGDYNAIFGYGNKTTGSKNIVTGSNNNISGSNSGTIGANNTTTHSYSATIGHAVTSTANGQLVVGQYNQTDASFSNDAFTVGYGASDTERKTLFTVPKTAKQSSTSNRYYAQPSKPSDAVTYGYLEECLLKGMW